MPKIVIFSTNNARIYQVEDASPFKDRIDAVIDPDLSKVYGIPPHFWKLETGSIVGMNDSEKEERLKDHASHGVDNNISPSVKTQPPKYQPMILLAVKILAGLTILGVLAYAICR